MRPVPFLFSSSFNSRATPISASASSSPVWKRFSGCFFERAFDDAAQRERNLRTQLLHGRRLALGDLVGDADHRIALERQRVGEELVQDDADREEVRTRVDFLSHHLLGRHVVGRAQHVAHLRLLVLLAAFGVVDAADAEVGDLHRAGLVDQHDVAGLDVAVDDAFLVRVIKRSRELDADLDDLLHRQDLVGRQQLAQRHAVDQLHRDVRLLAVDADVEDRDDVGVRQHARGARLAQEAQTVLVIVGELRFEQLDGDRPVDLRVVGLVDARHRAFADDFADFVPT